MRGLQTAVIVMGVLIVAGVAVIGVTIARRVYVPAPALAGVTLDEPSGSRIAGTSLAGDRLAVQLQGGGPDRVVVLDLRNGQVVGRVALHP